MRSGSRSRRSSSGECTWQARDRAPCYRSPLLDLALWRHDTCRPRKRSGRAPGVDVERLNRPILQWALWPHVLTAAEISRLPLAPAARRASLLALWVGKEAILKAAGVGLAVDPRHIELDESRRLVSLPHGFGLPADWSLSYLDHMCGCVGAVACRSPGIELEIEHRSSSKSRRSRVG